jgi:hypothetical protein
MAGAFRHGKYNPFLVALHVIRIFGLLFFMTGLTFGDNVSPQNFEPIPIARSEYAQRIWLHLTNLLELARPYMPTISIAPAPTADEIASFEQATPDSQHQGVFDEHGNRKSPPFPHHVDDNLYAEIRKFLLRTLAASVLSLYVILGWPQPHLPDPLSHKKLNTHYTHKRKACGIMIDTRRMTLSLPPDKRSVLVLELHEWCTKDDFDILEAASLCGLLSDAARKCRWAWPRFFNLRNIISKAIADRHIEGLAIARRRNLRDKYKQQLPDNLWKRLDRMVARDVATYIWRRRFRMHVTPHLREELRWLHDYLANDNNLWEIKIGHVISRDPTWTTAGDASFDAGAALCHDLQFLYDIVWSDDIATATRLNPKNPRFVHINHLEFIVVLLQLAAITQLYENKQLPPEIAAPVLLILTDNMTAKSWTHRVTARHTARKGQILVSMFSRLLQRCPVGVNAEYIPSAENKKPDFVSRISRHTPPYIRKQQILSEEPSATTWRFFRPSPSLISSLRSVLLATSANPEIPKMLGQFGHVSSTSSFSCTI